MRFVESSIYKLTVDISEFAQVFVFERFFSKHRVDLLFYPGIHVRILQGVCHDKRQQPRCRIMAGSQKCDHLSLDVAIGEFLAYELE